MSIPAIIFDSVHRPCRCKECVYQRLRRLLRDLDLRYGHRNTELNSMSRIHPFKHPEFLRSVSAIPFDAEADIVHLQRREHEASRSFFMARAREEANASMRGLAFGMLFAVCMLAAIFLWASL